MEARCPLQISSKSNSLIVHHTSSSGFSQVPTHVVCCSFLSKPRLLASSFPTIYEILKICT
jgi:hypothetical protein